MSRTTQAILSTEALLHNVQVIKHHAPAKKIIAMVKANAYGHGLRTVSSKIAPHVDMLGVASVDEALALRRHGVTQKIILMQGIFEPEELQVAADNDFSIVFNHQQQLNWLKKSNINQSITAWIKIDTGIGRLGFSSSEALTAYNLLQSHKFIKKPVGIMSHFACADDRDHPANQRQIKLFDDVINEIDVPHAPKSFCNSAAIFNFPEKHYDYVRPGIALYGASAILGKTANQLMLKPVMSLMTSLISVRMFDKGSPIGYGGRFICPERMPIGIVAMGYGDGYPPTAPNGTPVLIHGKRCGLAGKISMDMMAVDLRPCPHATVGDSVCLWGDELPVEDVALATGFSVWNLLTAVQNRVKFLWH